MSSFLQKERKWSIITSRKGPDWAVFGSQTLLPSYLEPGTQEGGGKEGKGMEGEMLRPQLLPEGICRRPSPLKINPNQQSSCTNVGRGLDGHQREPGAGKCPQPRGWMVVSWKGSSVRLGVESVAPGPLCIHHCIIHDSSSFKCSCCLVAKSFLTLCDPTDCSSPGFPVLHYLPEFAQTHVHWVSDVIQPSLPLLLLPSIFPSIKVFSKQLALCIRWPKYWSFNFTISPSNEHSGLISFKIDWLYLLPVQSTLKCLLQHHILKASILGHSAFFMVQLTSVHEYWKNHSFDYIDFCQWSDVSTF